MTVIRVCGVSLGSAQRDYSALIELAGVKFQIERLGVDGKLQVAEALLHKLDGKVDAIGLGGVNLTYRLGQKHYPIREGQFLAGACQHTPLQDGSFVKHFWEPELVRRLSCEGRLALKGQRVLVTSVLDRYPLAGCFEELGAKILAGDAALALKLPIFFPSLKTFSSAAKITMPLLSRLPLRFLYPLGRAQEERKPGWDWLLRKVNIIAGDFHLINRRLPKNLQGKTLLASTLTEADRAELDARGVKTIISLGVTVGQRSFGANILEAMIFGAAKKHVFGTASPYQVLQIFLDLNIDHGPEKVLLQGKGV